MDPFNMLAKIELPGAGEPLGRLPSLLAGDGLAVVAIGLFLLLCLMVSVRWFKRRRRKVTGGEKVFRGSTIVAEEEAAELVERRKYKRREKRRTHRSRNPTLAQTGGLPPARSDAPDDSP